jgi:hypothetical protein
LHSLSSFFPWSVCSLCMIYLVEWVPGIELIWSWHINIFRRCFHSVKNAELIKINTYTCAGKWLLSGWCGLQRLLSDPITFNKLFSNTCTLRGKVKVLTSPRFFHGWCDLHGIFGDIWLSIEPMLPWHSVQVRKCYHSATTAKLPEGVVNNRSRESLCIIISPYLVCVCIRHPSHWNHGNSVAYL